MSKINSDISQHLRWFLYVKQNIAQLEASIVEREEGRAEAAMSRALGVVAHGLRFPSSIDPFAQKLAVQVQAARLFDTTFEEIASTAL